MECNLKEILYPGVVNVDPNSAVINQTRMAQPLIFSIQYALSKLLLQLGIRPGVMMGHSIGEYTAAHLAGVFSLEDALKLVAARGRLMQELPPGAMLGVPLSETELVPLIANYRDIAIAAVNNASRCVVSGPIESMQALGTYLREKGYEIRRVHTSHAFHSAMMDPILKEFQEEVKQISLAKPTIPYISNLSGDWIKDREVLEPGYWSRHLRGTVRFSQGLDVLLKEEHVIFIEVGAGRTLSTMVNRQEANEAQKAGHFTAALMRHPQENIPDESVLLNSIGQLWLYGVDIHWPALYPGENLKRISLPGYPFEKVRCRLDESLFKKAMTLMATLTVSPAGEQTWEPDLPVMPGTPGESESAISAGTDPGAGFIREQVQVPRDEFEKKIALIWQEVLGFDQVGIYDNFFNLNGDSLSATQVVARVKNTFQVEVPLKDFFAEPTVAQLAQKVKTLLVEKIKNLSPEAKKKLAGN